ncbi:prephenate dehydrogenase TyrA [Peptoclostridium acidaminophilum DSM 3953]|uniref:Prephenate dehydrogenase TyrA n=1 Tax=Peptoclostridium acidaminophilum DSM 3953 TaxID=1286171 RepID=W8TGV6_PEPAC|nr:prephenate dehydrogenase [Peptoclostridium acidaminophilum]AHM55427.1 prephenate dehydrogenase TyrA [Peptoclostridium acidaminophilum DSM 3953]
MGEGGFRNRETKITIVGLGLIGGSYAKALKKAGFNEIYGIDLQAESLEKAKAEGIIKNGYTDSKEALGKSDLVIVCLYPKDTVEFIRANMESFKPGCIVTDVSGVKDGLIDCINGFIRDDIDFVGGHPMAGKEYQGIDFSEASLFEGANYLITPSENSSAESISLVKELACCLGCSNIEVVSANVHDRMIALTSHVPHVIALALISCEDALSGKNFTGNSFRDITRVANINEKLWGELFMLNRENLAKQIQEFQNGMEAIKQALLKPSPDELEAIMKTAKQKRGELD